MRGSFVTRGRTTSGMHRMCYVQSNVSDAFFHDERALICMSEHPLQEWHVLERSMYSVIGFVDRTCSVHCSLRPRSPWIGKSSATSPTTFLLINYYSSPAPTFSSIFLRRRTADLSDPPSVWRHSLSKSILEFALHKLQCSHAASTGGLPAFGLLTPFVCCFC